MPALSARDYDRVMDAVLALHSHRDLTTFAREVPAIFLRLIHADYFSLQDARVDFERKTVRVLDLWESRPLRAGHRIEPTERNLFDHPFMKHALEHGLERALILSDFLPLAELRKTRLYRESLRPFGIGRMLSIGSIGRLGLATITLTRPETERDFGERDRLVLEKLRPHFDQARANLERETLARANRSQSLADYGLTPRETEIALWLAHGKSNPEIAIILGAPVRTVEKHVERILRKMGTENRSAAALTVASIVRA